MLKRTNRRCSHCPGPTPLRTTSNVRKMHLATGKGFFPLASKVTAEITCVQNLALTSFNKPLWVFTSKERSYSSLFCIEAVESI